jgi:1,4-dihydroxy-2-naphthoate octaprenyltransferase
MDKSQKSYPKQEDMDSIEVAQDDHVTIVEEQKEIIEQLFEKTDSYIKTNVSLLKLKTVDKTASLVSGLTANLILFVLCFLVVLLVSVGAAIWVGQSLGNMPFGFMIMAGFYGILIVGYLLFGRKAIKQAVNESVISSLIKKTNL